MLTMDCLFADRDCLLPILLRQMPFSKWHDVLDVDYFITALGYVCHLATAMRFTTDWLNHFCGAGLGRKVDLSYKPVGYDNEIGTNAYGIALLNLEQDIEMSLCVVFFF